MKIYVIAIMLSVAATIGRSEPELKGTPSELTGYLAGIPKVVTISGEAEIKLPADRACVNLKVSTEARSLQDALNKNATLRQQISDELKKNGIPEQNISGSKFSSRPEYGIFSDKAKSYKIDNTIRVIVADENQFRIVATAIDAHSDASYNGVDFENSKESETKQKALAMACEAATAKKQLYEEKLGAKLTLQTFTEGQVQKDLPLQMQKEAYDYSGVSNIKSRSSGVEGVAQSISQFAEITYKAFVTVQYQIKSD
ncbi:MAG: SIMPL domain-containing protein [Verrucomicrobia bacterium]|nr:SIMPL domain-containing protein [Verrucomicrobiota bacterium]